MASAAVSSKGAMSVAASNMGRGRRPFERRVARPLLGEKGTGSTIRERAPKPRGDGEVGRVS